MIEKVDLVLVSRYLSGKCTEIEEKKVSEWLDSNPENRETLEVLKLSGESLNSRKNRVDVNKAWKELSEKAGFSNEAGTTTGKKPAGRLLSMKNHTAFNQSFFTNVFKYAAVFFFIISLPCLYFNFLNPMLTERAGAGLEKIVVEDGNRVNFTLSDGTKVTLDAGSIFYYPEKFDGSSREVVLKGEGFFEVSHNPEKPFIVHAGYAQVKVLGTKFNVRAWPESENIRVAVTEGKVSLESVEKEKEENSVIITKGQFSVLPESGIPSKPAPIEISSKPGWKNNDIYFKDTRMLEILKQLERWYGVKFIIDENLANDRLTIHIQKMSVDSIVELISALTDLKYEKSGNKIYFSQKDNREL